MEVRHMPKDPFTLFWNRYREVLIRNTLKPDVHRWYVAHVEKYIHACGGTKISQQDALFVENYFTSLGRNTQINDWQFKQHVNAIKFLYVDLLSTSWASNFEWDYWIIGLLDYLII
jgi:hypothetical protein